MGKTRFFKALEKITAEGEVLDVSGQLATDLRYRKSDSERQQNDRHMLEE